MQAETPALTWSRLQFSAAKMFAKGEAEILVSEIGRAEANLITAPGRKAIERRGSLLHFELHSEFSGRRSTIDLWLDDEAKALQRRKRRYGRKAYEKTWRFTDEGIYSLRLSPLHSEEARRSSEHWGQIEDFFYPVPQDAGCRRTTTPSALFYLASSKSLESGDRIEFCAMSRKTLSRVQLKVEDREQVAVAYRATGASKPVAGTVEALRMVVTADPAAPGGEREFEFLGLEDDIEIFVEVENRLPIEVRGRLPILGKVEVKLRSVDWRDGAGVSKISAPAPSRPQP